VCAVWSSDDRSSSVSGTGGISGDTGRVNVVKDSAGMLATVVNGSAHDARADRGLPLADGDFDLHLNSLRIRFTLWRWGNMAAPMGLIRFNGLIGL
jgi:hypothetical protein